MLQLMTNSAVIMTVSHNRSIFPRDPAQFLVPAYGDSDEALVYDRKLTTKGLFTAALARVLKSLMYITAKEI